MRKVADKTTNAHFQIFNFPTKRYIFVLKPVKAVQIDTVFTWTVEVVRIRRADYETLFLYQTDLNLWIEYAKNVLKTRKVEMLNISGSNGNDPDDTCTTLVLIKNYLSTLSRAEIWIMIGNSFLLN